MLKCLECGEFFERNDAVYSSSYVGEHFGTPVSQRVLCCPTCGSDDLIPAKSCKICGEYFGEDDIEDGVCSDCLNDALKEYRDDFDKCLDLCKDEKENIEINPIFAHFFTESQINEILLRELKEANGIKQFDFTAFLIDDKSWFIEKMLEVKNGK